MLRAWRVQHAFQRVFWVMIHAGGFLGAHIGCEATFLAVEREIVDLAIMIYVQSDRDVANRGGTIILNPRQLYVCAV